VLAIGATLQLAGFAPNGAQRPLADLAIRGCVSLLPAGLFVLAAGWLRHLALEGGEGSVG
jgi:Na+/melibiose symporter-like transporter